MDAALSDRLRVLRERVAAAARDAGRDPGSITTIVVTKFQPVEVIRDLRALGVTEFGESRWPEVRDKAAAVPDVRWHFIGRLQTNKARQVARHVAVIHSVDDARLLDALARGDARPRLLVQVSADGDPSRGGAAPADVPALADRILTAGLDLAGVMLVAPPGVEPSRAFALIRDVSDRLLEQAPEATWISAGMSGDLEAAIAAGATHVRVGTAAVGPRPAAR